MPKALDIKLARPVDVSPIVHGLLVHMAQFDSEETLTALADTLSYYVCWVATDGLMSDSQLATQRPKVRENLLGEVKKQCAVVRKQVMA